MILLASASLGQVTDDAQTIPKGTPKSVRDLIGRRLGCNHWSDEDPHDDNERLAEILSAAKQLKCQSLDQDQQDLEMKFRRQPKIIRLLKISRDWEPD
jgi:hypothetical protein